MDTYGAEFNKAIAAELRAQRARVETTVDSVVQKTGLSKSAVLYYLNGKRSIPLPAFYDICAALDADPMTMFAEAQKQIQ